MGTLPTAFVLEILIHQEVKKNNKLFCVDISLVSQTLRSAVHLIIWILDLCNQFMTSLNQNLGPEG